ncbi:hypothetical protein D3C71_1870890 [compost metagenome]
MIAGIDGGGRRHGIQDGQVFKPVALDQQVFEGGQSGKGIRQFSAQVIVIAHVEAFQFCQVADRLRNTASHNAQRRLRTQVQADQAFEISDPVWN